MSEEITEGAAPATRATPRRALEFGRRVGVRAGARGDGPRQDRAALRALHRRQLASRRGAASTSTRSTQRPRRSSRRSPRPTRATSTTRCRPRAARTTGTGRSCAGSERAKYVFRIARALQEKARELAIVESMDGGKPIKESRDVDLPLAAAHFFYHAGWADKLDYAFHGRACAAARRRRADHPVELPAAHGGVEARARRSPAGTPSSSSPRRRRRSRRSSSREIIEEAELPPGVVNIVTGAGATGAALAAHAGVDKVAFTGLDRGRQADPAQPSRARRRSSRWSSAARRRTSSSPTRRSTRPSRGSSTASTSTRGTSAAPARASSSRRASHDLVVRKLARPHRDAARRRPARQEHRRRRHQLEDAARQDPPSSSPRGEEEGAERVPAAPCALPAKGYFFAPTFFTGVAQSSRIAREEIFGPVLSILTFRTPDEASRRRTTRCTASRPGVWTDKGAKIFWMAQRLKAGVVWGNTYNKFDPSSPFGGYKESGFGREGGRHGLVGVHGARMKTRRTTEKEAVDAALPDGTSRAMTRGASGRRRVRRGGAGVRREGVQDVRRRRLRPLRERAVLPGARRGGRRAARTPRS